MEDIIIAGYSLAELKKQRQAISKDANKYISDEMEKVTKLIGDIKALNEYDEPNLDLINEMSEEAVKHLQTVQTISAVSGVEYYLDYYDNRLSYILDEHGVAYEDDYEAFTDLYETLQEMERSAEQWNASTC